MVPALAPAIEMSPPIATSTPPAGPRNTAAASATGVSEVAIPGSVPAATHCTATNTTHTMPIVDSSANGTSRRPAE